MEGVRSNAACNLSLGEEHLSSVWFVYITMNKTMTKSLKGMWTLLVWSHGTRVCCVIYSGWWWVEEMRCGRVGVYLYHPRSCVFYFFPIKIRYMYIHVLVSEILLIRSFVYMLEDEETHYIVNLGSQSLRSHSRQLFVILLTYMGMSGCTKTRVQSGLIFRRLNFSWLKLVLSYLDTC